MKGSGFGVIISGSGCRAFSWVESFRIQEFGGFQDGCLQGGFPNDPTQLFRGYLHKSESESYSRNHGTLALPYSRLKPHRTSKLRVCSPTCEPTLPQGSMSHIVYTLPLNYLDNKQGLLEGLFPRGYYYGIRFQKPK